jgi:hypothetical protein
VAVQERPYHAALATWTGKTPLTLLNELCQRNQWDRPQVNAVRAPTHAHTHGDIGRECAFELTRLSLCVSVCLYVCIHVCEHVRVA